MKRLRLYLDTSVINHLFHDDAVEKQTATIQFFESAVRQGRCEAFVSFVVLGEIRRTPIDEHRTRLLTAISDYELKMLRGDDRLEEARKLATAYLKRGILRQSERRDALHVALATVHNMDGLVSWNFKHMVNVNKEILFRAANTEEGYHHPLRMMTPQEVDYE